MRLWSQNNIPHKSLVSFILFTLFIGCQSYTNFKKTSIRPQKTYLERSYYSNGILEIEAEYLNNKLGKKIVPKFNGIGSNINPKRLVPDIKNTKKFKWKPKINLYKGLNIYLKWFLKYNKND